MFEHTAFRLEVRDRYDEAGEREALDRYLAGDPGDVAWLQEWLDLVAEVTAVGKRISRVRVVTAPLSDYSRFGVWCAQFANGAGEDIRYLLRDQANEVGIPKQDYWLFDSTYLVRMDFDRDDVFLGSTLIEDPALVVQHNYWRDAAWHHAVRRDDFASQHLGRS